jgi:hypothetical protein
LLQLLEIPESAALSPGGFRGGFAVMAQKRQICARHHVVHAIAIAGDPGALLARNCFA